MRQMAVSVHEIHIIVTNYSHQFDAEELEVDLEQIVEQYRRDHFQIYKKICKFKRLVGGWQAAQIYVWSSKQKRTHFSQNLKTHQSSRAAT